MAWTDAAREAAAAARTAKGLVKSSVLKNIRLRKQQDAREVRQAIQNMAMKTTKREAARVWMRLRTEDLTRSAIAARLRADRQTKREVARTTTARAKFVDAGGKPGKGK